MKFTLGVESQNFTFAPKETISCSGSMNEGTRVDRKPIKSSQVPLETDYSASKGICYMSDSELK